MDLRRVALVLLPSMSIHTGFSLLRSTRLLTAALQIGSSLNLSYVFPDDAKAEILIAVLEAIATFDEFVTTLQGASDDTQLGITCQRSLVTDFTEAGLVKAGKYKLAKQEALIAHALLLHVFVLSELLVDVLPGGAIPAAAA